MVAPGSLARVARPMPKIPTSTPIVPHIQSRRLIRRHQGRPNHPKVTLEPSRVISLVGYSEPEWPPVATTQAGQPPNH